MELFELRERMALTCRGAVDNTGMPTRYVYVHSICNVAAGHASTCSVVHCVYDWVRP